jgi:hypothetical protein
MISLILIKGALMMNPIKNKNNIVNIFCSCKDFDSKNNFVFPYSTVPDYSKNNDNTYNKDLDIDINTDEPEHISIDNLYLEKVGPEIIINPYSEPLQDFYGPYND